MQSISDGSDDYDIDNNDDDNVFSLFDYFYFLFCHF